MKFNRSGRIPFSTSKRGRETEVAKRNRGGIEEVPDRNFKFLASPPSFGVWLHCAHQRESKHQEERCPLREGGGPRVYLRVFTWHDPVTPTPLYPSPSSLGQDENGEDTMAKRRIRGKSVHTERTLTRTVDTYIYIYIYTHTMTNGPR